jgi:hypothetical protein
MCHAKLPFDHGHGYAFRSELRRLGRRGESWAYREADRYANDPWLRVVDRLDDLDYEWHALPRSASTRARALILARAERWLARL